MIANNNNRKFKTVIAKTPNGDIALHFQYGENFSLEGETTVCDSDCPYVNICALIPDPENPDDEKSKFCEFCTRRGDEAENEKDAEIRCMHPVEGSLENDLGEIFPSIIEIIKEKNPIFRLNTIIDRVCPNICGNYNPEHSECKGGGMCIMTDLFKREDESIKPVLHVYETDRENPDADFLIDELMPKKKD